jgi:superfamily I DNA/RNA helicase/RecB family exonuclease
MAAPQLITDPAARGFSPASGRYPHRVIGGPGTGKTSLLVEAAATHIAAGADPDSVLLLCPTARAAVRTRRALSAALALKGGPAVIRQPLVRTLHSYAFAVLRLAAQRTGDPPPRLVTGTEQDGIIRELLAGDLEDGPNAAVSWPEPLRPALTTAGFATALRDLLARCAERGVDGLRLQRIGRLSGRPEWVAAGQFAMQYEQVMLLRAAAGRAAPRATVPALGAAELVGATLEAFASDPGLYAAERDRVRVLLVDDAQHLDPQAARLVQALSDGAAVTVIAGDPNQTVFGFRGADPGLLTGDGGPVVTLTKSHRCAPTVARAVSAVAARLPGAGPGRVIEGTGEAQGSVAVRLASSARAEAALIADELRRAHLVEEVPWSQMAVIVRSLPRAASVLPRALAAAGIPVRAPTSGAAPVDHPAVRALLTALSAATQGLDGEKALTLVTGPIGRIDPVSLRALRRGLRRADAAENPAAENPRAFGDLLVDALTGGVSRYPAAHASALRRVGAVLDAPARLAGEDPRRALWQAWRRSGLERRWLQARTRGGAAAAQADRDLDAVTALFDIADDYVARTSGATVAGLVEAVSSLKLPPPDREPLIESNTVAIVSAHAALGREWDVVVIAGMQEGLWPNTVPRGGVLATQQLVDVLDGVAATASRLAPVLADERRLLVSALGRARRRVLITAVDSDADDAAVPSVFVDQLRGLADVDGADRAPAAAPRVLAPAALIGRLRAVVCAPEGAVAEDLRRCAATQLARLAVAGVPGADPASWYGMTAVSTDRPLWNQGPVTLSPSTLATIADCPLRWLLERHGGKDGRVAARSVLGSVLHALIADEGKTEAQLVDQLEKIWDAMPFDAGWYSRNELARHRAMLSAFCQWRAQTRHEMTEVGTEVDVDGVLGSPYPDLPDVRVRGRIDRLERDGAGRLVVVDVKTGKRPVSKDDAQRHAQLAMYQLAVAAGLSPDPTETQPGGGRLVYLGKPGIVERDQDALTPDAEREWRLAVHQAAAATSGPTFLARVNDNCGHCPVRSSCPAREPRS